eukprot:CAMPEP_0181331154 /NCGR_PEP_ID=MMETSP1101-20121128/24332_1 /TAXON_ID=46948 /ORGANISM="Rhodomonas abbreviata, Strain Caron Lab Isolate" /LENGTH=83 /DNA_ID=CAMNT_0023440559 /DNA_START=384 /DNA_END=634 /DNA_ORIENTATION=+
MSEVVIGGSSGPGGPLETEAHTWSVIACVPGVNLVVWSCAGLSCEPVGLVVQVDPSVRFYLQDRGGSHPQVDGEEDVADDVSV